MSGTREIHTMMAEGGLPERRYGQPAPATDVIVWEADAEFAFTFVSDRAERLLGYPAESWLADPELFGSIIHPADRADTLSRARAAAAAGLDYEADFRMIAADGRTLWFHQVVRVLRDAFGGPREVRGVMIDVTHLRESAETAPVLEAMGAAVIATDVEWRITQWNARAQELYGWSADEAMGKEIVELLGGNSWHAAAKADEAQTWEGELQVERRDGERITVWMREDPMLDERGEVVGHVALSLDEPPYPAAPSTPALAAILADNRDPLTGLANRHLMRDHLELSVSRTRRRGTVLALLHVIVESPADTSGGSAHAARAELLKAVATRLDGVEKVEVAARSGEDDFLLAAELEPAAGGIQDGGAPAVAQVLAGRVHDLFAEPFEIADARVKLAAHVGISLLPLDANSAETMLDHAKSAAREARRSRGGIVIFRPKGSEAKARLSLATSLRGALDRDEFQLHYQPMVDLRGVWDSGRGAVTDLASATVGVEALIRWQHPNHGLVAPGQFLPMLDDHALVHRVAEWVLDEVCRQVKDWRASGLTLDTAFNLSLRELADPGLLKRLVTETDRAGVERRSLVIEVSERATMADPDRIEQVLRDLAEAGFHLAIHDFGTGQSSLARLWRMPVKTLKIDRSFTAGLLSDPAASRTLTTIVRMAEGLGMRTLAEGIETEEQLRFLVTHGCNLGQGHLFSRPVPARELSELCANR